MEKAGAFLKIALLVLFCICGKASPVGGNSTCETSGTVFEGESATVTCHFHRPNDKFMIYILRATSKREIVTVCTHTENGPVCNLLEGHTVTTTANRTQAVLHIASARQKSSGKYFCKTLPASEDNAENCTLVVQSNTLRQGSLVTCKASKAVPQGEKSWLSCQFSKFIGSTGITLARTPEDDSEFEEEIAACDAAGQCTSKKDGYVIEEKNEAHVKISIPELEIGLTGNYKCRSTKLKEVSDSCLLTMKGTDLSTEAGNKESALMFAILGGLFALLALIVICALIFCVNKLFFYRPARDKAPNGDESSKPLHPT